MVKVSRVEYDVSWADGTSREAAFTRAAEREKGESAAILSLACESPEEAEEILGAIERYRARKVADALPRKAKGPKDTADSKPTEVILNPSKLAPDVTPTTPTIAQDAKVASPPAAQEPAGKVPADSPAPPSALRVVPTAPAAPVDAARVNELVARVKAEIPAAVLADAQMKTVLLVMLDAGAAKADIATLTAACEALRGDSARLAKIARMEDRVVRTLTLIDSDADSAQKDDSASQKGESA